MVGSHRGVFVCEQIADDGHKGGKDGQLEAANRYQCYDCNQVCHNANALRRHCRQAHGKDRCHICPVCDKAFKRATHLKVGTCRMARRRFGFKTWGMQAPLPWGSDDKDPRFVEERIKC